MKHTRSYTVYLWSRLPRPRYAINPDARSPGTAPDLSAGAGRAIVQTRQPARKAGWLMRGGPLKRRIGLAIVGALLAIAITTPIPASAAVTTSKNGTSSNGTTTSSTETRPNDIITWIINYSHTGPLGSTQLDDAIPAGTQYVPNSLVLPPGFNAGFSTNNGGSYSGTDGGTGTTNIRANGPAQPTTTQADGTSITSGLIPPPQNFAASTAAGDGTEAFFYNGKIYNINHHNASSAYIQCHTKQGVVCNNDNPGSSNYTPVDFPTYASATLGDAFGTGTQHYQIPNHNFGGIDQANGRVYMPVYHLSLNYAGIACFDLKNHRSCGFTKLTRADGFDVTNLAGGALINNRFYTVDSNDNIYCVNTNVVPATVCGSPWPMVADPTPGLFSPDAGGGGPLAQITSFDNRYLFVNFANNSTLTTERSLSCIDTQGDTLLANDALCGSTTPSTADDFPKHYTLTTPVAPANGLGTKQIFMAPILNTSGQITGICGANVVLNPSDQATSAPFSCYDLATGASSTQPWTPLPDADIGSFNGFGSPFVKDARIYLPYRYSMSPNTDKATYDCWDFATNARCTVPVAGGSWPTAISPSGIKPYTLREDAENPGCVWEVGDTGQFQVIDIALGTLQCSRTTGVVEAQPSAFYCGGSTGNVSGWQNVSIRNFAESNYLQAELTIRDQDNNIVVPTRPLTATERSSGEIDLSSFSTTTYSKLTVTIGFGGVNEAAWTNDGNIGNDPFLQLAWDGDPVQFCFQTRVLACSQTTGISNTSRFTTSDETEVAMATKNLAWSSDSGCGPTPNLSVNKSATPSSGLVLGTTITYTITSTNMGNIALEGIMTTDPNVTALGCTPGQPVTLQPNEAVTCTGTRTVTQADVDAGSVNNTAETCGTPQGGTTPICRQGTNTIPVTRSPQLGITKTVTGNNDADGSGAPSQGDTLTYRITVTNTGNVTIVNPGASDSRIASLNCTTPASLAPTESFNCTGTYVVTAADQSAGNITNTATCSGTPPAGTTLPVCTTTLVTNTTASAPGIQLIKTLQSNNDADQSASVTRGDTLTYALTARNSGSQTLTNVNVSDPMLAGLTCSPSPETPLPVNATVTCTGTHVVTQAEADAGKVVNDATVTGQGSSGQVTDSEHLEVPTASPSPSLHTTKTASPASGVPRGSNITYNILVHNNGNVTLSNVRLTDTLLSSVSCTPAAGSSLAPDASMSCTGSYTVTQADVDRGEVRNIATATGKPPGTAPDLNAPSPEVIVPLARSSNVNRNKILVNFTDNDGSGGASAGDVLHLRLTATNEGSVTLTGVSVSDTPVLDSYSCTPAQPATLQPGQTVTCNGDHTVTQAEQDAGRSTDTMTTVCTAPAGAPACVVSDLDREFPLDPPRKSLGVNKSVQSATDPDLSGDITPGDVVTYRIVATNTGNVSLRNVSVSDPTLTGMSCTPALSPAPTLAPGASITCTGTYTVTPADVPATGVGTHENTATAQGTAPDNTTVNGQDTRRIQITPPAPDISLVKAITGTHDNDNSGNVTPGDVLDYTLTAQNTGNVVLTGVTIGDNRITNLACTGSPTLAPAASRTCTGSLTVTQGDQDVGEVTNTGNTSGTAPDGSTVAATDTATQATAGRAPNAAIDKSIDEHTPETRYKIGDTPTYRIIYSNRGNVSLDAVTISDNRLTVLGCDRTGTIKLAPGEEVTCTGTGPAFTQADMDRKYVENTAAGVSTTGLGQLHHEDSATALLAAMPDSSTTKVKQLHDTNGNGKGDAGETITYGLTSTNTGNTSLLGVTLTDTKLTALACDRTMPATLAPGETIKCTGNYRITERDTRIGHVHNIATTTAEDPTGIKLTSFATQDQEAPVPLANTGQTVLWTLALAAGGGCAAWVIAKSHKPRKIIIRRTTR